MRLAVEGRYLIDAAWDARGRKLAVETSDEQFETFNQQIIRAR